MRSDSYRSCSHAIAAVAEFAASKSPRKATTTIGRCKLGTLSHESSDIAPASRTASGHAVRCALGQSQWRSAASVFASGIVTVIVTGVVALAVYVVAVIGVAGTTVVVTYVVGVVVDANHVGDDNGGPGNADDGNNVDGKGHDAGDDHGDDSTGEHARG